MNFGDILDEWDDMRRERASAKPPRPARDRAGTGALEAWLAANGVVDKDSVPEGGAAGREAEGRRLAALRHQDSLDLHGMGAEEARAAVYAFISASASRGLEKVLVIHGKGLHSGGKAVLKRETRAALEAHPLAGRFGEAAKADGGSGALWVIVRAKR